jgi:hypothetical protein
VVLAHQQTAIAGEGSSVALYDQLKGCLETSSVKLDEVIVALFPPERVEGTIHRSNLLVGSYDF